jgi:spore maturation protein CgeB
MRIFCAVRHSNDPRFFYGGLWSSNFYPALREQGGEVIESQTDLLPTSRFMDIADGFTPQELEVRARTTQQILDEVREAKRRGPVHLFLSYFYNAHFDPAGFDELRRLYIPSVNFYCNGIQQFALVADIAARADFSWHPDRVARKSYLAIDAKPITIQMAADPNVYRPVREIPRQPKAVFMGQNYADRARWISALIRDHVPVDIFGHGWERPETLLPVSPELPRSSEIYLGRKVSRPGSLKSYYQAILQCLSREGWRAPGRLLEQWRYRRENQRLLAGIASFAKGPVPLGKIAEVFSSYDLCLNFSNVWADGRPGSPLIPWVRLRDFEGPMCRTCYLTGHTDEIAEYYEIGREVDTYRTRDELVDKARFYLTHPDVADRLRERGEARARRDHTWKHRFAELFKKIELRGDGNRRFFSCNG